MRNRSSNVVKLVGTVRDITYWKKVEETLCLQASALQSAGNAIVITDSSGAIMYTNRAFTRLTGYTSEEVEGKTMQILNSGIQDEAFYTNLWKTITSGVVWHGHLVNRRKDGTLYDEEETITPVRTDAEGVTHFIAIKRDVTEQMRAEKALKTSVTQMQELSARLEMVREEERKSLSHEVHDELGQILTAIKMKLLDIERDNSKSERRRGTKIRSTVLLVDEAMARVRDIAGRLRPGLLDFLGLVPAMEWQIEQFEKDSGIECHLDVFSDEPEIDSGSSTVFFRILQEALTNVARHAVAGSVDITLSEYGDEFMMKVTDDGVGINQEDIDSPRSFGLLGIRERLRPFGGNCSIRRRESGGTEILVYLPKRK